jgi:hypothetical protein
MMVDRQMAAGHVLLLLLWLLLPKHDSVDGSQAIAAAAGRATSWLFLHCVRRLKMKQISPAQIA